MSSPTQEPTDIQRRVIGLIDTIYDPICVSLTVSDQYGEKNRKRIHCEMPRRSGKTTLIKNIINGTFKTRLEVDNPVALYALDEDEDHEIKYAVQHSSHVFVDYISTPESEYADWLGTIVDAALPNQPIMVFSTQCPKDSFDLGCLGLTTLNVPEFK